MSRTITRKYTIIAILIGFAVAVAAPLLPLLTPKEVTTRVIDLTAKRYGYTPARIVVNQGDTVVLRPTSLDVTHGFLLDGYGIDAVIKQKGLALLKYTWTDDEGRTHTDWDKVREIEFTADKTGKFVFRCTQTCGNLHPFMTGELIVRSNTPYHLAGSLSIWLTASLLLCFYTGMSIGSVRPRRINLFEKIPLLKRAFKARSLQFWIILPNLVFFYLFILSAFWGSPVGNRNIAVIFVWILWWTVLKAVLLPFGGRVWCLMCPLPAPGEWLARKSLVAVRYLKEPFKGLHHRFLGLNKDWPKRLNNIWLQNALFLLLISFGIILITRPVATATLFLLMLGATLLLSLIFRGRVFCRFLCPVGGFLGTYSMAATTELRAVDADVCRKHTEKNCLTGGEHGWACPWGVYTGKLDRNNHCGLCTECVKSCPKDNVALFLRPFGADQKVKGWDEVLNILIMLAVALAFSVTMLGPWGIVKQAANVTESGDIATYLIYLACVLGLALILFPGLFFLSSKTAAHLTNNGTLWKEIAQRTVYAFIPLGIFAWIAFSLPQVMISYTYILSVLSDPLGLGWNLLGTANLPFKPFQPEAIPVVQGVLLLAGLYFTLTRGFSALGSLFPDHRTRVKAFIPAALLGLAIANVFMRLYMG